MCDRRTAMIRPKSLARRLAWRAVLQIILVVPIAQPLQAQPESPPLSVAREIYRSMGTEMLEREITRRLLEALPPKDRAAAEAVPVYVTAEHNPYRTGFDSQKIERTIRISAGFLMALDITNDATALARRVGRYEELPGYAAELSYVIRHQWWEKEPRHSTPRMYSEYIGLPSAEASDFRQSREYRLIRLEMMRQSLVWINAHYYAHLIVERRSPSKKPIENRASEAKVDVLATDIAYSAGYSPMPPLANTVLFASIDHPDRDRHQADWLCRATLISKGGLEKGARARSADTTGRSKGGAEGLRSEVAEIDRVRRSFKCSD